MREFFAKKWQQAFGEKEISPERKEVLNEYISTNIKKIEKALVEGQESIGGNAGIHEGVPHGAFNFLFDIHSGEILIFTNYANKVVDSLGRPKKDIREATIEVAYPAFNIEILKQYINTPDELPKEKIVKIHGMALKELSEEARYVLTQTKEQFNTRTL